MMQTMLAQAENRALSGDGEIPLASGQMDDVWKTLHAALSEAVPVQRVLDYAIILLDAAFGPSANPWMVLVRKVGATQLPIVNIHRSETVGLTCHLRKTCEAMRSFGYIPVSIHGSIGTSCVCAVIKRPVPQAAWALLPECAAIHRHVNRVYTLHFMPGLLTATLATGTMSASSTAMMMCYDLGASAQSDVMVMTEDDPCVGMYSIE